MKMFHFGEETAQAIQKFGSQNAGITRITKDSINAHIGVIHFKTDSLVGYHQAIRDQLFMVVHGNGWVTGEDRQRVQVTAGQAALWRDGEWHESGSEAGMTAVVIEAEKIESILPQ